MAYTFTEHWLVQNSPASQVPSHGTRLFATSYAIDIADPTGAEETFIGLDRR